MNNPINAHEQQKRERCRYALGKNGFEVFTAADAQAAGIIFLEHIRPALNVKTASWGDSMTLAATGVLESVRADSGIRMIETFDPHQTREERNERRRQALLADLFLTGTSAVTESGVLVNLDMVGNRIAGLTFGPKNVVLFIGRNKIVPTLDDAFRRIKGLAAPANAIRHSGFRTPCMKTAVCMECSSPDRICNTWCITEKSFPPGRIKVILIDQDLGL
jgi:L-lactate utilization protein LutB